MSRGRSVCSACAILAFASSACVYRGKQVGVEATGRGAKVGIGATRGWAIKEVVQKSPPRTLLARDGTICMVEESRYEETRIGAQVQCDWR